MIQHTDIYKRLYFIGFMAYAIFFVFAILFYKERIIFLDSAFILFNVIRQGTFAIFHFRYIEALSEIFPLLASKANCSLSICATLYSLSYVIVYILGYLICGLGFKKYDFALIILLINSLMISDTFYYTVSELNFAIVVLILLLAWLSKKTNLNVFTILIAFAVLTFILSSHPLVLFPFVYAVVYFFIKRENIIVPPIVKMLPVLLLAAIGFKYLFLRDIYEANTFSVLNNFQQFFPHYLNLPSNKFFLSNCTTIYYWLPVLLLAITVVYIVKRRWLALLLFYAFCFGYVLMVNVSFPIATYTPIYTYESWYMPLSFFIALPLVFDVLPFIKSKLIVQVFVICILLTCCIRIYKRHHTYTNRLNYLRQIVATYGDKKTIIDENRLDMQYVQMSWALCYEVCLLSEIEKGKSASIVADNANNNLSWAANKNKTFVATFGNFTYPELNARYFHLNDTLSIYRLIR
jgi:hypothetical protein